MKFMTRQRGFSTILAVVVITLLALVGAYMSTMVTTSSISSTLQLGGMQGWFAARSAAEWGTWQALHSGSGCGAASGTLSVRGFSVNVTCSSQAVSEGPDNYTVYNLLATAQRGTVGEPGFVSRTVRLSVTDGP